MLRLLVIVLFLSTVVLIVAAVFFMNGPFGAANRRSMADMDRATYAKVDARWHELNDAALVYFKRAKYEEARALWTPFVEEYPRHVEAHYRLGVCLSTEGRVTEGIAHLESATELAPDDPRIRKELGIAYLLSGRLDDAERELKAVLQREKDFPEAHFYLGMACEKRGEYDRALEYYVDEVNSNPDNTFAWDRLQRWETIVSNREARESATSGAQGAGASEGPR